MACTEQPVFVSSIQQLVANQINYRPVESRVQCFRCLAGKKKKQKKTKSILRIQISLKTHLFVLGLRGTLCLPES